VKKRMYEIVRKGMSLRFDKDADVDHVSSCFKYHVARRAMINIT